MPRLIEEFDDFKQRMARTNIDPEHLFRKPMMVQHRWLFWNGARSDGNERHIEPPDEEIELLKLRVEYVEALLDKAVLRYRTLRHNVAEQAEYHKANAGASPDDQYPNWRQELERLGAKVESLSAELRTLAERGRALCGADVAERHQNQRDNQRATADNINRELAQLPNY